MLNAWLSPLFFATHKLLVGFPASTRIRRCCDNSTGARFGRNRAEVRVVGEGQRGRWLRATANWACHFETRESWHAAAWQRTCYLCQERTWWPGREEASREDKATE